MFRELLRSLVGAGTLLGFGQGFRDGFEQGPMVKYGSAYESQTMQEFYGAGAHLGCGAALLMFSLARRSWPAQLEAQKKREAP